MLQLQLSMLLKLSNDGAVAIINVAAVEVFNVAAVVLIYNAAVAVINVAAVKLMTDQLTAQVSFMTENQNIYFKVVLDFYLWPYP